jgi:glyoxylase-like metal-dependent hydrolase (beta-lactamase superfamily II)
LLPDHAPHIIAAMLLHHGIAGGIVALLAAGGALAAPKATAPVALTVVHAGEDPTSARIGTYVSSDNGFRTSSYWIEGEQGVVIIDTQFLLSAAEEVITHAERSTGKKVVLAIVLHPNPDKFNGAAVFNRRGIRVITSAQVLAQLPAVHELRKTWFYDDFKPDYPADLPHVESFGDRTQVLDVAGLKLQLHVLGRGCSEAHVAVEYQGHLFPGDLVTNDYHSWLELGFLPEWLGVIAQLRKLDVQQVHPGRGPAGTDGLLAQQEAYLQTVLRLVRAARPRGPATEAQLSALQQKIEAAYPGYRYPRFVENGLAQVWLRADHKAGVR